MGELEEKETPPTETQPQQEVHEEPKETDRMLEKKDDDVPLSKDKTPSPGLDKKSVSSKPNTPLGDKKSGSSQQDIKKAITIEPKKTEEIIDIPSADAAKADDGVVAGTDEKKISKEEREVKPKKIPIGGLKLPGFFMKSKPKTDGDGADGELLEKEPKEDTSAVQPAADVAKTPQKQDAKPRTNFGERLRNFFVRKPAAEKQAGKQVANGDADAKSEATAEATPADGETGAATNPAPPQKRGLLNAIKLPIANIIPKKKSDDDVELGLGGKAGLASMETLDDSLKDQDCVDRAAVRSNGSDELNKLKKSPSAEIKAAAAATGGVGAVAGDEKSPDNAEQPATMLERLRAYKCSVDDVLISFGILLFVLLLCVIGYVLTMSSEARKSPPLRDGLYIQAVTSCGLVEGMKEDSAYAFRGIPYAVPPVGERRWRPAQLVNSIEDCWNGTLLAYNSSNVCTQRLGNGTIVGDEDCLYLDLITPDIRYDIGVPVIVLIGAESLTGPSPGILRPSARYSHSHHVVFVRPNFRLGAFGFLALDALTKESYPRTSGNYGLSDILTLLNWIQLNIHNFGGDPKSVILLGHRAGATLVSALITSKQAEGLYSRAWTSSSAAIFPGKPLKDSEQANQEIMQALDCQDVECLRAATTEQIWSATPDTWLHFPAELPTKEEANTLANRHEWLVLDGVILQQHPSEAWKREHTGNPVLVIGTTAHESHTPKLRERHSNWTATEVREYLQASQIGALNLTDEVIQRYNATNYNALAAIITDIRTICPLLTNARLQPSVPFYVVTQGEGDDQLATVDADVQAILGRYEPHTYEQRRFVSAMQQLFYYYVAHGKVPQHDPRRRVINLKQDPLTQEDHENCNYWISKDIVPRYARID